MEDFLCSLTCGYRVKYNVLKEKIDGSICWLCKTHPLDIKTCLNMPFSRMNQKQKEFEIQIENFTKKKICFDACTVDIDFLISESLAEVKNDLDLEREKLKTNIMKKIDEWYFELSGIIEDEYMLKKNKFLEQLESIKLVEQELKEKQINDKLEPGVKLNFLEEKIADLKNNIKIMETSISNLNQQTLEFFPFEINFDNMFGKIKKEVKEAKIELTIEEFSQFKKKDQVSIYSESSFVRNLEWNIRAYPNFQNGKNYLSLFLYGYGNNGVKKWKANVNAEFRVLNLFDSSKDKKSSFNRLMSSEVGALGFNSCFSILELENPINGFHDAKNDNIKIEVQINVDKPSFTYL